MRYRVLMILAATLAAGCQAASVSSAGTSFVLGQEGATTVTDAGLAPRGSGILTVKFIGILSALAQRHILATVADIDHVTVTLRYEWFPDIDQTISTSDIAAEKVGVTFTGLPPGPATVILTAFDAEGQNIGMATQAVTVQSATVTPVDMAVQLVPTPATPAPSSGGSDSGNTGSVSVTGTFVDGPVGSPSPAAAGTVLSSFSAYHNAGFVATGHGTLYIVAVRGLGSPMGASSYLAEVATTDGAEIWGHYIAQQPSGNIKPLNGPYLYDRDHDIFWFGGPMGIPEERADRLATVYPSTAAFALDATGQAIVPSVRIVTAWTGDDHPPTFDYMLERAAVDGTRTVTDMAGCQAVAIDSTGNVWTGWTPMPATAPQPQASLKRYKPDGSLLDTVELPFVPRWMQSDSQGAMWVTDAPPHGSTVVLSSMPSAPEAHLVKIEANGDMSVSLTLPLADFCVTDDQCVWVAKGDSVSKLNPDGSPAVDLPLAACFVSAGDGVVYAGDGATISKLAP